MEEDQLQYASVVFKSSKRDRQNAKKEEVVYADVKRPEQTIEPTADATRGSSSGKHSDSSRRTYQKLACALGTLCVLVVLVAIVGLVYVVTLFLEKEKLQTNQTFLLADNHNLTVLNVNLSSHNANLMSDINNVTKTCNLLESKLSVLTDEIQNLTVNNLELLRLNHDLVKENESRTEELKRIQSSEANVSRAQWSINAYCSQRSILRQCDRCPNGWVFHDSSCYAFIDYKEFADRRSWNEAQDDCKRKSSDLVVIGNDEEEEFVGKQSRDSSRTQGYWMGLRAIAGKWKWVDGSELLPDSSTARPVEGHCVISYGGGWASISCDEKNRWTCEKKALSFDY